MDKVSPSVSAALQSPAFRITSKFAPSPVVRARPTRPAVFGIAAPSQSHHPSITASRRSVGRIRPVAMCETPRNRLNAAFVIRRS